MNHMVLSRSRRTFLLGTGGLVSASLAWGLWRFGPWVGAPRDPNPVAACCTYADYDGWIVTPSDKEKLTSAKAQIGAGR